jgi:hypothetical protein
MRLLRFLLLAGGCILGPACAAAGDLPGPALEPVEADDRAVWQTAIAHWAPAAQRGHPIVLATTSGTSLLAAGSPPMRTRLIRDARPFASMLADRNAEAVGMPVERLWHPTMPLHWAAAEEFTVDADVPSIAWDRLRARIPGIQAVRRLSLPAYTADGRRALVLGEQWCAPWAAACHHGPVGLELRRIRGEWAVSHVVSIVRTR